MGRRNQIESPNFMLGLFPHATCFHGWDVPWRNCVWHFFRDVSTTTTTNAASAVSSDTGGIMDGNAIGNTEAGQHKFRQDLCGMPWMYQSEGGRSLQGVIFMSCYDSLCLTDVVSYYNAISMYGYGEVWFDCGNSSGASGSKIIMVWTILMRLSWPLWKGRQ